MYNSDTDLLFPSRVIPTLRELRGEPWLNLIDRMATTDPAEVDHIAFILVMVRLNGCATCYADSYKAMRGCTQCARQAVRRFRGDDGDLIEMYTLARQEVCEYLGDSRDPLGSPGKKV